MRTIKKICGPEFDTGAQTFDAGTRKLFVIFTEKGVRIRAARTPVWRFVSWEQLYTRGAMVAADFNPAPRTGRIRRGAV